MFIGVVTKNEASWCSKKILEAFKSRGVDTLAFSLPQVVAQVGFEAKIKVKGRNIDEFDGLLVRPIGSGSLEEILFRVDTLHRIARLGIPIVNHPKAIERAADKYFTLTLLEDAGVQVPKTIVTENTQEAVKAFSIFGGEVVVKPIFGSRGMGITKVLDVEVARRIFRLLGYNHFVLYLQEYVPHGGRDIRCFVLGNHVVAAMYRVASDWRTNISLGGQPSPFKPNEEMEKLAVKAAEAIGCELAGVDLMEGKNGLLVNEVNSQPGFKGLQISSGINIAGEIAEYVMSKVKR